MVLKPLQAGQHCSFARLASSDCLFIGSQGCTLLRTNLDHSLLISDHNFREQMLSDQASKLGATSGAQIRGPFNKLLTVPIESLDHAKGTDRAMAPTVVPADSIDVSTPLYPRDLTTAMGVCLAIIGRRTEVGVGTFNILVHLLPTGHLKRTIKPFQAGKTCCSRQFTRWASNIRIEANSQRKSWYLTTMLNIFRSGEWNVTVATPVMGEANTSRWISHVDIKKHLVNELAYDNDAVDLKVTENVKVTSSGKIYLERDVL